MRRLVVCATALIVVATASIVSGAAAQPRAGGASGWLVFDRARGQDKWFAGGTYDVLTMTAAGSRVRRLVSDARDATVSPDGRRIAFLAAGKRPRGIWVAAADGKKPARLTTGEDFSPEWSADGTLVFFARYRPRDDESAIHAVKASRGGIRRLTVWDSGCESGLAASPNGRLLAFEEFSCDRPQRGDIAAIDMEGRRVELLQEWKPPGKALVHWPGSPAWSPNGALLGFSTIESLFAGGIYVSRPDGRNARSLVEASLPASDPAWSSDGQWLAFGRDRVLANGYPGDIWLVRANGTGLHRITNTKMIDEDDPEWLPAP